MALHALLGEREIAGVELLYPFEEELRVTRFRGKVTGSTPPGGGPGDGLMWPPFRGTFGEDFYSYQLSLDLEVPAGWAVRTEPHPRLPTPTPATRSPLAVPALIRSEWWPMMFFCIFKAPPKGVTHVFRKDEPFMSLIVLPAEPDLDLQPMTEEEAAGPRDSRPAHRRQSRHPCAKAPRWLSTTNTIFDRRLPAHAPRRQGLGPRRLDS